MDNEYEVKVTMQALEQMGAIVHYISYDLMAPEAAENLLNDLKAALMKLSVLPKRHSLIDEEPWRSEGVRKIVVKNFLVYYWVDDESNLGGHWLAEKEQKKPAFVANRGIFRKMNTICGL